ncbi:MAG: hypothetical protein ACLFWL_05280 [Candidatus Brocadiia bacterium]
MLRRIVILMLLFGLCPAVLADSPDVTNRLKVLGSAVGDKYTDKGGKRLHARSVHDMAVFGRRIYLGSGDATINTGPTPIYYYDMRSGQFGSEGTVKEEMISKYCVIWDRLCFPGIDPTGSGRTAIYVQQRRGQWDKILVPQKGEQHGAHVFDVCRYGEKLFVAIARWQGEVVVSEDRGNTWSSCGKALDKIRTVTLFECGGELYMTGYEGWIKHYNGDTFVNTRMDTWGRGSKGEGLLKIPDVYSGYTEQSYAKSPVNLDEDTVLYIGLGRGKSSWNDHTGGLGLFRAEAMEGEGAELHVTHCDLSVLPDDVTVSKGTAYVLANTRRKKGKGQRRYRIEIFRTENGKDFTPLFHLYSPTRASSMVVVNGNVFIGLGCTYSHPHKAAGLLLYVSKRNYR